MYFYKITQEQADLLGEFSHNNINFSPYVRQQKDDTFIVSQSIYELLKDTEQFKKIDWTNVETTETFNDKITLNFEQ